MLSITLPDRQNFQKIKFFHLLISGHTRTCWSVVFHPTNPHLLASGDLSAEVRVWDISDSKNGYEVWRHEHQMSQSVPTQKISISLSFHPTDNVLLIGNVLTLLYCRFCLKTEFMDESNNSLENQDFRVYGSYRLLLVYIALV